METHINKIKILVYILISITAFGIIGYTAWYSYDRNQKIQKNEECSRLHEAGIGDGSLPCVFQIVPPTLWNKVTGNEPTLMINDLTGCDQSATTTDCSKPFPKSKSEPYIPPNPAQPKQIWTSATSTPTIAQFKFELPEGWTGELYEKGFAGGTVALVRNDTTGIMFRIDCPPDGKGLEAATRLSSETRTFNTSDNEYSAAFEEWTAPENEPWYFVWVRAHEPSNFLTDSVDTVCIAQGKVDTLIYGAMRMMYDTLQ